MNTKQLFRSIRIAYWQLMYQWSCVDVHYFLRIDPHKPSLDRALKKSNRYHSLLLAEGECVA